MLFCSLENILLFEWNLTSDLALLENMRKYESLNELGLPDLLRNEVSSKLSNT